jgi:hypothetical protein
LYIKIAEVIHAGNAFYPVCYAAFEVFPGKYVLNLSFCIPIYIYSLPYLSSQDKLTMVLNLRFLNAFVLHEFACTCAERLIKNRPLISPRCIYAVTTKRKWLRGKATSAQLADALVCAVMVEEDFLHGPKKWIVRGPDRIAVRAAHATALFDAEKAAIFCSNIAKFKLPYDLQLMILKQLIYWYHDRKTAKEKCK